MSELKLNPESFKLFADSDVKETLSLSIWNGRIRLGIFSPESSGKAPLISKGLNPDALTIFKSKLKSIIAATPGTRYPIIFQDWDKDNRKYISALTLVIGKDEKQGVNIECSFLHNNSAKKLVFPVKASNSVTISTEPMADAAKAIIRVEAIIDWLNTYAPVAMLMTSKPYDPNSQGGNRGGSDFGGSSANDDDVQF